MVFLTYQNTEILSAWNKKCYQEILTGDKRVARFPPFFTNEFLHKTFTIPLILRQNNLLDNVWIFSFTDTLCEGCFSVNLRFYSSLRRTPRRRRGSSHHRVDHNHSSDNLHRRGPQCLPWYRRTVWRRRGCHRNGPLGDVHLVQQERRRIGQKDRPRGEHLDQGAKESAASDNRVPCFWGETVNLCQKEKKKKY